MTPEKELEFYQKMYLDISEVFQTLGLTDLQKLCMITDILCDLETKVDTNKL